MYQGQLVIRTYLEQEASMDCQQGAAPVQSCQLSPTSYQLHLRLDQQGTWILYYLKDTSFVSWSLCQNNYFACSTW